MKRFVQLTTAAAVAAALIITSIALVAPADYSPSLAAAAPADSRIAAADAAGYAPRTSVKRVSSVLKKRTAKRKVRGTKRVAVAAPAPAPATTALSEADRAKQILAGLVSKYPILEGTTVEMGYAQGYQAICYYRSGRIVISPTHTATLERILNHEIWHVIDFRADGAINWGENLPPANASSFAG